ncbi:DeoR/GlpR family DNA-binding transcription regulator [Salaquimonas pukyongi]|uniref:DeoR/GlpR family DNA-binding transcription regulator n=1 Tax=Salaquimonas pukyongi TaxID=2712698 RepID=UPI00096B9E7C|nr:DeoR/GlpR family DNA-binding transcription regulator [Salaquimonas pukyongi]
MKNERFTLISRLVDDLKSVTTDRLVEDLSVSRETVRRDLLEMEALGLLRRVHGGAVAMDAGAEPPLKIRSKLNIREKQAVAKAARGLITDHKVVFFDAGSTTTMLASQLAQIHDLHVITNSLEAAKSLQQAYQASTISSTITLLGGSLGPFNFATVGCQTIAGIRRVKADLVFLSPTAISLGEGAMNVMQDEADVAEAMLENSRENAILADATKFSAKGYYRYCGFEQMDTLITDARIRNDAAIAEYVSKSVSNLIIAD